MDSEPNSPISLSPSTPRSVASDNNDPFPPLDDPLSPPIDYTLDKSPEIIIPDSPDFKAHLDEITSKLNAATTANAATASTAAATAAAAADGAAADSNPTEKQVFPAADPSEYDANGQRTVIDYYTNEHGQYIKRTRVMQRKRINMRVRKSVEDRRKWDKFGDCENLPPGPEKNVTMRSTELVHLNLKPKLPTIEGFDPSTLLGSTTENKGASTFAAVLGKNEGKLVVCSHCGAPGHWSLKCPKRSKISPPNHNSSSNNPTDGGDDVIKPSSSSSADTALAAAPAPAEPDVYVPSYLRGKPPHQREKEDLSTIRITNLSENAREDDVRELCRQFGYVSRVYVAKDQTTGKYRGFAFVTFEYKEDGQRAIDRLHRHAYDNLILAVEWAKPRAPAAADATTTSLTGKSAAAKGAKGSSGGSFKQHSFSRRK